ncbi:MAG: thioesterase family protein, partial [Myxococcota bacterium]|nr:thioesterase family protein [Myxococcota bacterium]
MPAWPGETMHTVGVQDCGPDGRMNAAPLVALLQRSRSAYWSCLGAPASDHPFRVWDLRVKFLRTMRSGERLLVRPQCDEIGQRTIRLRFLVFDASTDAFVAEASSMVVVVDSQGRDRDVPSDVRAAAAALEG